tara:strand:- start:734 stop:1120 length:387 start_codon:yes stop_codon:yes gene_type:complete
MISKVFSTIGIVFVASLLLVGCDEAAEEASESGSAKQEVSEEKGHAGSSMKAESELTEDEKKKLELAEKLHKATDCGGFDQTCTHKQEVNLYAIKDEKSEVEGGATLTRTNDGRNRGTGLWSKLKKKE